MKFIVYIVLLFFIEQCVWIAGLAEKKEESKNQLPILALALINQPTSASTSNSIQHNVQSYPNASGTETVTINRSDMNAYNISIIYSNLDPTYSRTIKEGLGSGIYSQVKSSLQTIESDIAVSRINRIPREVEEFNQNSPKFFPKDHIQIQNYKKEKIESNYYLVGNTKSWKTYSYDLVATTLRKRVTIPNTSKSLHIWVANNMWTTGTTDQMINQTKVDYLADYFAIRNPSIYNMVKTIVGEEWGSHFFPFLIAASGSTNNEIHIVLYDINNDGSWGTLGFFYAVNNYTTTFLSNSNEALAFFIDAPTYGEMTGYSWEITDGAPMQIISTLAHEFQHMIHFYQKSVLMNASSTTWLNELSSMSIEDSLAMNLTGSKTGPGFDLLPGYVQKPNCTLTTWNTNIPSECTVYRNYETAYSFGGYLIRNYGGADLIKNIVQSNKTNTEAIDYALSVMGTGIDFKTAFMRWGASFAMDKNKASIPSGYGYPTKSVSNYFGSGYHLNLEELNIYESSYSPRIYLTPPSTIYPMSHVVHKKYTNKKGSFSFPITVDTNVKFSVVVSPY